MGLEHGYVADAMDEGPVWHPPATGERHEFRGTVREWRRTIRYANALRTVYRPHPGQLYDEGEILDTFLRPDLLGLPFPEIPRP
jgi:hypothetical protein